MQLRFQDQDFSWKFLFAVVAFPILVVDFLRAFKLLIDPEGHALLDSTDRQFTGQLQRSPPKATVIIGFVQPYKPMVESSSSAHTSGAASAGAARAGAASARAASAGAASAGAASAAHERAALVAADVKLPSGLSAAALSAGRTASMQNPQLLKAAYSRLLDKFPKVVCASKCYCRSAMMSFTTSSHTGHPLLPNSGSWMARSWLSKG